MITFEKKREKVSAGEIAYLTEGDRESPPVVLLHGFPASSFLWRELIPMLAPWMRVIAPDLIGSGDSQKPTDVPLHIRAQAGYVRELLGEMAIDRFAVIGHGDGGGVAQLLAVQGGVEAMVLLDSAAFDASPGGAMRGLVGASPEDEPPAVIRHAMRLAFDRGMGRSARLTEESREEYLRPWAGDEGVRAYLRALRACDGLGLVGIEPKLARLECPVLLLWGEDDPFAPVVLAERLSDTMPMSTLALLPGCSHYVMEDAPETVIPLVFEYLRSRYLQKPHGHADHGSVTVQLGRRLSGET